MDASLGNSELILNADGSIYHLNLLPEDIADTIITVGDPDRVQAVSKYFDTVEIKKQKREFVTHTGTYAGKRITVISTGIGTDNIDIVFNELDALANIDFKSREIKQQKRTLNFIRVGTSGSLQANIPVDSFLMSSTGVGFDNLLHFYDGGHIKNQALEKALSDYLGWSHYQIHPYAVDFDQDLANQFTDNRIRFGITATNSGFYGPQGRSLRLAPTIKYFNEKLAGFSYDGRQITNLEMETSGMYGLAKLHGHRAVSLNAILANRATGEFSKNGHRTIDELIQFTLEHLSKSQLV
ncbi:MAG: nucleoside phosphorylase [Muricauda sp.]|jgi:uridine phosphorylase|nr:nucleoside phosphorylase [Allomuricauda sp.]MBO6589267.1 nucleoside phosphorylase [Allomuricauda sp.]MBO6618892.1 nucleoside phosphorylase [Allomuricauda sp.]MBO6644804.1 nucleoside phosphorylase [Allomuricauda sp.]MBO6746705.1 nucleoside phosphorylase [Allomuricauda sp.]MBO6843212.1 nucleoside phosphorylase [Allomuricauda sp.]